MMARYGNCKCLTCTGPAMMRDDLDSPTTHVEAKSERVAPADGSLDQIARLEAEISRLTKARAALAERLRDMADYEHRSLSTHGAYSLETCPFVGCRENAYALRLGKPRRKAVRQ